MKKIISIFIVFLFSANLSSADMKKDPGTDLEIMPAKNKAENPEIPGLINPLGPVIPVEKAVLPHNFLPVDDSEEITYDDLNIFSEGTVVAEESAEETIMSGEYLYFEIDPSANTISYNSSDFELSAKAQQALEEAPKWLRNDLKINFRKLSDVFLDEELADLILNAPENLKDEVAFQAAHLSYETLTDSRFRSEMDLLVRNADLIYEIADSLQYVRLAEHGSFESGDYFTTTQYRVMESPDGDTVWVDLPMDKYYWYIVMPKIHQEGVYAADNPNNVNQRTYGYFWREYIWSNPNPDYDYTEVNKTTTKGTIETIPRFGELAKKPKVLWNRQLTYYPFGREFSDDQTAVDMFGNWASRAIPVDAVLPRAIQPNQALYEHNGNCGEDAYLVAAMMRTALIPFTHLNMSNEDHAFGAFWDGDWHHYEFFRGGLSPNGNQFYGITNILPGGSYSWVTSLALGTRPDGYQTNHTKYYTETCEITLWAKDKTGAPAEGSRFNMYANPYAYGSGFAPSGNVWAKHDGTVTFEAGARTDGQGKTYAFQVYHPSLGLIPSEDRVYIVSQQKAVKDAKYEAGQSFSAALPGSKILGNIETPGSGNTGIRISWEADEIISGVYEADSRNSRFKYWLPDSSGAINVYFLDEENFEKFRNNSVYRILSISKLKENSDITIVPPDNDSKYYAILDNRSAKNTLQHVKAKVEILEGDIVSVDEEFYSRAPDIFPNPFNGILNIDSGEIYDLIEIYDHIGTKIETLPGAAKIWDASGLSGGVYYLRFIKNGKSVLKKAILSK